MCGLMTSITKRASGTGRHLGPLAFLWHHRAHAAATTCEQLLRGSSDGSAVAGVVDHFQLLLRAVVVIIVIAVTRKCAIQEVWTCWTAGCDAAANVWTGTHRGPARALCLTLHNCNRSNTKCVKQWIIPKQASLHEQAIQ